MIRAFSLIHRQLPQLRVIAVGTKTDFPADLLALRDGLGLTDTIGFIGSHPDITDVIPAFDFYLSSSLSEIFSLTIVEAMAAGLAVVSTRSGGPEEIVRHGETGLLVDVANAVGIADAILRLARDQARRRLSRSPGLGRPLPSSQSTPWCGPTSLSSLNSLQDEPATRDCCADATQVIRCVSPLWLIPRRSLRARPSFSIAGPIRVRQRYFWPFARRV